MNDAFSPLTGMTVVALALNVPGPVAAAPSWYACLVRDLEVLRLDLREPDERARLEAALREADLLLTSVRSSVLDRLALDWDRLHVRHSRLCHVAISGEAPPHGDRPGHDLTYQAQAGLIAPPAMPRTLVADMAAADQAVASALALLLARERGAPAGRSNVALVDAAASFAEPLRHGLTSSAGSLDDAKLAEAFTQRRSAEWEALAATYDIPLAAVL